MKPENIDHVTAEQRPASLSELKLMQELGRDVLATIHKFADEKKVGLPYGIIVGAFQYVAKLHGQRMQELSDDFTKLEAAADHLKLNLPEPFTDEIKMATEIAKQNPNGQAPKIVTR